MDLPLRLCPDVDNSVSEATPGPNNAQIVFHIPELLEQILLHLPQKDILLSQRTSRSFRHTTQGSIRLQRALFLAPDWNLEARTYDAWAANNRPGRKPENNRLLLRAFPGCYPTVTLVIVNDSPGDGLRAIGRRGSEHWSWDVCIAFPADHMPVCNESVNYPEASWRRMFLSQPPCTTLHLVRRWQRSLNPAIEREVGITMGDFYEEAIKAQTTIPRDPTPAAELYSPTSSPGSIISNNSRSRRWHESYISSDRDWHFEGNIKCSSIEE